MFIKVLGGLIGFVGVTLLFWLGLVYDRLPAGWPNTSVALPLGIHWTFHMPWAGAVTAAEAKAVALQADLKTCHANVSTLDAALSRQNAAVIATAAAGQRMSAEAQAAVLAARAAHKRDMAKAWAILAEKAPANEDELTTCRRADRLLLDGAQ